MLLHFPQQQILSSLWCPRVIQCTVWELCMVLVAEAFSFSELNIQSCILERSPSELEA